LQTPLNQEVTLASMLTFFKLVKLQTLLNQQVTSGGPA